MQLLAESGDEQQRRVGRVTGLVVAQFDPAADVDDGLVRRHADARAASAEAGRSAPALRRYTIARPPRPGAVATPRE